MQEDGFENCTNSKIFWVHKQSEYLFNLIPERTSNCRTRKGDDVPYFNIRHFV